MLACLLAVLCMVAGCSTAGASESAPGPVAPARRSPRPVAPHGPLIAYGHSYLAADPDYAQAAARGLGVGIERRARGGARIAQVDNWVSAGPWRWQPGQSDLVLLDATINDVGTTDLPTFARHLQSILDAISKGPALVVVMAPVPVRLSRAGAPQIAPYAAVIRAELARYPNTVLADAGAGWNPKTDLGPDGLHPNDAGRALLARAVLAAVHTRCPPNPPSPTADQRVDVLPCR